MQPIRTQIIIEILGKPQEYVMEMLDKMLKQMDEEKGVKVIGHFISEIKKVDESSDFFSGFMDIELETETLDYLMVVCFKYMPAHIEIITPEIVSLKNNEMNAFFNELVRRLHAYDEIARVLQIQNQELEYALGKLQKKVIHSVDELEEADKKYKKDSKKGKK